MKIDSFISFSEPVYRGLALEGGSCIHSLILKALECLPHISNNGNTNIHTMSIHRAPAVCPARFQERQMQPRTGLTHVRPRNAYTQSPHQGPLSLGASWVPGLMLRISHLIFTMALTGEHPGCPLFLDEETQAWSLAQGHSVHK